MTGNQLTQYMNNSIAGMVKDVLRETLQNPRETAYLLKLGEYNKKNSQKRLTYENAGQHVPAFLISSITHSCNLTCKGCYARANGTCADTPRQPLLTAEEWGGIFRQAAELGVSFNLLAGGEPLLRQDVLLEAAKVESILFPVFTNGTLLQEEYLSLFHAHRNLVPILSLEGGSARTDERRGPGMYQKLSEIMQNLRERGILFGVSLTVTRENLDELTSDTFLSGLARQGCRLVFYVEYVPVEESTRALALNGKEVAFLERRLGELRLQYHSLLFLSFPGDEKFLGGCLAGGRGFFHINPYGAAEPCPFSPYSDCSLKECTLQEALNSPFFRKLQDACLVGGEHSGGCALFEQESRVKELLSASL